MERSRGDESYQTCHLSVRDVRKCRWKLQLHVKKKCIHTYTWIIIQHRTNIFPFSMPADCWTSKENINLSADNKNWIKKVPRVWKMFSKCETFRMWNLPLKHRKLFSNEILHWLLLRSIWLPFCPWDSEKTSNYNFHDQFCICVFSWIVVEKLQAVVWSTWALQTLIHESVWHFVCCLARTMLVTFVAWETKLTQKKMDNMRLQLSSWVPYAN